MRQTEASPRRLAFDAAFRIMIVLLILWAILPTYFTKISSGLDPSWIYAVNIAGSMGYKFGADTFFTYGPLGFLGSCVAVAGNAAIYFWFYGILVALVAYLLFKAIVLSKRCSLTGAAISAALLCCAAPIDADYFVSSVILLAVSLAWFEDEKRLHFAVACALTAVSAFIKFSGSVLALSAIASFVLFRLIRDRRQGLRFLYLFLLVPVLVAAGYLAYNPSFSGLKGYVLAAIDISSGYNSAMSLPPPAGVLALAAACAVGYGVGMALVFRADRNQGMYLLVFCGAFFMAFKHGFVRADHAPIFFKAVLLWNGIFALFLDFGALHAFFRARKALAAVLAAAILMQVSLPIYYLHAQGWTPFGVFQNKIGEIAGGIPDKLASPRMGGGNRLPDEFLAEIGDATVAVYPAQQSIGAYNDVRFVFMPVIQAYSAYTPRLDKLNAAFFGFSSNAPEYVVFDLGTIDIRLPLIECPLTWLEIFSHYSAVCMQGGYLLLKKTDAPFEQDFRRMASVACRITDPIEIPESDQVVAMQIDLELNGLGKFFNLFYQVPPVFYMRIDYAGGATLSGRVIPENLASPTLINYYPDDLGKAAMLLNAGKLPEVVKRIQFSGTSLRFYKRDVVVVFSESKTAKPPRGPCVWRSE